ncbi:hypothetical protein [Rugosimonospora africana]|uniref:hypothetical protein n=1 Tax=Rugosimonospora africana TaxID=556532 RepID=UPI001945061F|nr:hypothetical protein [Rugosimonospora africana]
MPHLRGVVHTPSDAVELIARRHGEPAFDAAVAAAEAGPDLTNDNLFNSWQQRAAPMGYAAWGPAEQAHAMAGRWSLPAVNAYFSLGL